MNIRQIALVASDLEATQGVLFKLLGLQRGFHDPAVGQFGLHNVVMRLGDTYLEVVAPAAQGTTAERFLARRGGDSGYMVLVQVEDLAAERERVAGAGIRIVWEVHTSTASGVHLHPKDVPGAIASLDQMVPAEHWYWAGEEGGVDLPQARNVGPVVAAEIQSDDPAATAACWSRAYGVPLAGAPGSPDLTFDDTVLRFRPASDGRGPGLAAVDVVVRDLAALRAAASALGVPADDGGFAYCGMRFNLVAPP